MAVDQDMWYGYGSMYDYDSDVWESNDRPLEYGGGTYYTPKPQDTSQQTAGQSNYWNSGNPNFGQYPGGGGGDEDEDAGTHGIPTVSSRSRYGPVTGQTTVSRNIRPDTPMPTYTAGTFDAPEWDEDKIKRLAQKHMASGVRRLRQGLGKALVSIRQEENPNVKREQMRKALEGLGTGLSDVAARARITALGEYGKEYATEYNEAIVNFEAQEQAKINNFNAAFRDYLNQYTSVSSTQYERQDYGAGFGSGRVTALGGHAYYSNPAGTSSRGYNDVDALGQNLFDYANEGLYRSNSQALRFS